MAGIKLAGLRLQAYEHPSDAAALNALTHTAGFDTLITKLNAWGIERFLRVQLTGSYLKVTQDSFPDLYQIFLVMRDRLDVPIDVDVYIASGGEINAFTVGVERPLIVLTTAAVELLAPYEMAFVIAHELGHIKSRHVLYYQIAEFLPLIAGVVGSMTFGIGELLSAGVQVALLNWKRMSEFTADRAGLLGCQDAEVAWRTMMKLAGLPPRYFASVNTEDFLKQARDFQALDADTISKIAKWLNSMGATHPWMVARAQQLLVWIESGQYEEVLKNPQGPAYGTVQAVKFCNVCGNALKGTEAYCPRCRNAVTGYGPPPAPPLPPGVPPPFVR